MNVFTVEQNTSGHFLRSPQGEPFLSVGLNHAEETNLLFPYNIDIWKKRYGTHEGWLKKGLVTDLEAYGFNTIGWTQDVIAITNGLQQGCVHSQGFSFSDYLFCDVPYCVSIEAAAIQQWNNTPLYPDVFSPEFAAVCEYNARNICARHSESEKLIGYFFADIPAFCGHNTGSTFPQLSGLNPGSDLYERILGEVTQKYYDTLVQSVKLYDKHHLILGDRFNGNCPDSDIVYKTAAKYCDVISVQYFSVDDERSHGEMLHFFDYMHDITKKPILLADIGSKCKTELNPDNRFGPPHLNSQKQRAQHYIKSIDALLQKEYFIGWHWCAYIENPYRGWGIKSHLDEPYNDFLSPVAAFNKAATIKHKKHYECDI